MAKQTNSKKKTTAKAPAKNSSQKSKGPSAGKTPTRKKPAPATKTKTASKNAPVAPAEQKGQPAVPTSAKEKRLGLIARFRANRSEDIPVGRSYQTRDEFFEGGIPKEGKESAGNYRKVYTVDTNSKGEMIVAKSTTSKKDAIEVTEKCGRKERVRPFLHTHDDNSEPIKPGKKFIENSPAHDISDEDAEKIIEKSIRHPDDFKKYTDMKKRKK